MGLKVYKADEASRDYENDFFREFSSNLVRMFDEEGLEGILIGHPNVPANKHLKPDCVLITPTRLVLIDFKNHEGKMWLPEESAFEDTPWRHDGVIIAGGTSINPFEQLKRQKGWVEELIGSDVYGKFGIACLICFQGGMNVMNKVPGKYQSWFSITNAFQYVNRIRDIIGVKNSKNVDVDRIASYFEAKPYHDYYSISLDGFEAVSEAEAKSAEADRREYEATQKVTELEKKIKEAESKEKEATELTKKLKTAKKEAVAAKKAAEEAKSVFDEKKHNLELETQKAIKAQADAAKAKSEEKIAEIGAMTTRRKIKARLIIGIILSIVALIGIGFGIWTIIDRNNREAERIAEEKAQLEEDYKNGRVCIPVEKVADYLHQKGVCVDFYANYINDSTYYVFIDNTKNGTFALMISKDLLTEEEANLNYLNKHLEARGTITKYEDTYEIEISDLSQITVK